MIANDIFLSKLVYLIPLWGGCESFLLRALQTIQNKAARVVTNQGIFTSTKVLLRECGWLSVAQLVFFHSVVLLFKTRLTKKPRYLFEMAEIQENTRYGTRTSHKRKLFSVGHQLPSNQLNWNSYRWRSVRSWNLLPREMRELDNVSEFKKQLKIWVRDNVEI